MSIILTPFAKLVLLFYDITGSYGVSLILNEGQSGIWFCYHRHLCHRFHVADYVLQLIRSH